MSMYEEKPAGEPAEPGAPPPADDVAVPEYSGDAEGMASSSWWDSMSLTVFGKQVTNEQAKTIIYVGALALVVVTVALVVTVSGGGGGGAGGGGGGGSGGPRVVGGWDGSVPPCFSATAGRNSGQGVVVATTDRGPRNPIRMGFGSQCKMASAPFGDCSGAAGARCGITPNGEVYAWIMASVADCVGSPTCAPIEGRPVRYGCSRAELGDSFVECCVAIETPDTTDCSDPVDVTTDFASTRCVSTVANTDTAAGRTAELASGGRAYAVSCVRSCENTYAKHSCDHCSCVFGCQAATSGQSFSSCMTNACANPANPPVGLDGGRCDLKSPRCAFAGDACNAGCNIPYNADAVTPPALKFEFDGNLLDTSGSNHGRSHFNPPGSEVWADGRPGSSGSGQSLVFDNDDYVTLRSPFPAEDTEFSLAVWLAPREIVFDGWHAFVGYQNGGVCPGRSPSMWVDGGGHGDNEDGVWKGLHYDSCEQETSTRFAGVLENFFTTPDEFVHVAW